MQRMAMKHDQAQSIRRLRRQTYSKRLLEEICLTEAFFAVQSASLLQLAREENKILDSVRSAHEVFQLEGKRMEIFRAIGSLKY